MTSKMFLKNDIVNKSSYMYQEYSDMKKNWNHVNNLKIDEVQNKFSQNIGVVPAMERVVTTVHWIKRSVKNCNFHTVLCNSAAVIIENVIFCLLRLVFRAFSIFWPILSPVCRGMEKFFDFAIRRYNDDLYIPSNLPTSSGNTLSLFQAKTCLFFFTFSLLNLWIVPFPQIPQKWCFWLKGIVSPDKNYMKVVLL